MKYLGVLFNEEGSCGQDIENRSGTASKVIGAMRSVVLERRELIKGIKTTVLNAMVVPALMHGVHGVGTWTIQTWHETL